MADPAERGACDDRVCRPESEPKTSSESVRFRAMLTVQIRTHCPGTARFWQQSLLGRAVLFSGTVEVPGDRGIRQTLVRYGQLLILTDAPTDRLSLHRFHATCVPDSVSQRT